MVSFVTLDGVGAPLTLIVPEAAGGQRFYRIVLSQQ
jgi:hypothetical protein